MSSTLDKQTPWYFLPMVVLVAGCLVAIVNFGVRSTFGQFTLPISTAHGWPRETFSFAIALQNLLWGIATPLAGAMADRYGAARVLIVGALVYALGIVVMAFSSTALLLNLGGGMLVGIGVAFSSFGIVMAALGRIVPPAKRSWAFGIATASGSLGQFIFSPLAGALLAVYSWQTVLIILASSCLLIIPFALPLMVQNATSSNTAPDETSLSMMAAIKEAFGHGSYLLLFSGFFVCGFQLAFVTVHLPPYLAEHGITKEFAGLAMGLIGLFNVVGAYTAGILGARNNKRFPLSLIYLFRAIATATFILLPITPTTTLLFTATLGFLWLSTVPFTMQLVITMFGTRYMATLYGFVFLSHQIGSFLGVWLGGKLYDQFGSYDPVWWISIGLAIFAFFVHLPIRERRAPAFAIA